MVESVLERPIRKNRRVRLRRVEAPESSREAAGSGEGCWGRLADSVTVCGRNFASDQWYAKSR